MQLKIRTLTMPPNAEADEAVPVSDKFFQKAEFVNGKWEVLVGYLVLEEGDQRTVFAPQIVGPFPPGGQQ